VGYKFAKVVVGICQLALRKTAKTACIHCVFLDKSYLLVYHYSKMENLLNATNQPADSKRYVHVYIARESDDNFDLLFSFSEEDHEFAPRIVAALRNGGSDVEVIESDDDPVDVLCLHVAPSERIPA
jgi:hypothetical protein